MQNPFVVLFKEAEGDNEVKDSNKADGKKGMMVWNLKNFLAKLGDPVKIRQGGNVDFGALDEFQKLAKCEDHRLNMINYFVSGQTLSLNRINQLDPPVMKQLIKACLILGIFIDPNTGRVDQARGRALGDSKRTMTVRRFIALNTAWITILAHTRQTGWASPLENNPLPKFLRVPSVVSFIPEKFHNIFLVYLGVHYSENKFRLKVYDEGDLNEARTKKRLAQSVSTMINARFSPRPNQEESIRAFGDYFKGDEQTADFWLPEVKQDEYNAYLSIGSHLKAAHDANIGAQTPFPIEIDELFVNNRDDGGARGGGGRGGGKGGRVR